MDYSIEENSTGGYSFSLIHQVLLTEGMQQVVVALSLVSDSDECRSSRAITFMIHNASKVIPFNDAPRLKLRDDFSIHLFETDVYRSKEGLLVEVLAVNLLAQDLMEMNDYKNEFLISGLRLPAIGEAIDEYLKQIMKLPLCHD